MHVDWRDIMSRTKYNRTFRLMVAKEALLPENRDLKHVIAEKYGIMPWTVIRWREHLAEVGEAEAFRYGFSKGDRRTDREKTSRPPITPNRRTAGYSRFFISSFFCFFSCLTIAAAAARES